MAKSKVKAGEGYVEIGLRNRIARGARGIQRDLDQLSGKFTRFGATAVGAASAVIAPLAAATLGFASAGDRIDKLRERTGVGAVSLSELAFAAEQTGSGIGGVERTLFGLSRSILDLSRGSSEAVDAYGRLGITFTDLEGLSPEQQLMKVADGLAGVTDESMRGAIAQKIFGRSGRELLPLLKLGAKGIAELKAEGRELGRTLTEEDAAAAAQFTDAMNRVISVGKGVTNQLGASLAPVLTEVADLIAGTTKGVVGFIRDNREIVQVVALVAAGIGIAGVAFIGIGATLALASTALGGFIGLITFLASPIGAAIVAVGGLGIAIFKYTNLGSKGIEFLKNRFGPLVETVKSSVGAIVEAVREGNLEKAWELTTDLLEVIWLDLTDELRDAWDSAMGYILDAGSVTAKAIGQIIQAVAGILGGLLDSYRSTYDAIFDFTSEKIEGFTGQRTIGERSSAFDAQFGKQAKGLESAIDSIRQFGVVMEDEAEGQITNRMADRQAAKEARQARLTELRDRLAQAGKEAEASRKAREAKEDRKEPEEPDSPKLPEIDVAEKPAGGRSGSAGTFGAFAATIIGRGDDSEARMLIAMENMAESNASILDGIRSLVSMAGEKVEQNAPGVTGIAGLLAGGFGVFDGPKGDGEGGGLISGLLERLEANKKQVNATVDAVAVERKGVGDPLDRPEVRKAITQSTESALLAVLGRIATNTGQTVGELTKPRPALYGR